MKNAIGSDSQVNVASLIDQNPELGIEPAVQLQRIVRAARTHLNMHVAFISQFASGKSVIRDVDSKEGYRPIVVGDSDLAEESYCHWMAEGKLPRMIPNTAKNALASSLPVTAKHGIGAFLGAPIRLRDGQLYGTFCCFSSAPNESLASRDLATLDAFAELAGQQIQDIVDSGQEQQQAIANLELLTPREREVLEELSDGASNKAVARRLGLSPRTVEMHRARIIAKLQVDNLTQALARARDGSSPTH